VALKNDPAAGLTINADGAGAGLGVTHRGDPKLTVSDQRPRIRELEIDPERK
jgi:hypothetical protein